jgi:thiol:disulfide interchange protein
MKKVEIVLMAALALGLTQPAFAQFLPSSLTSLFSSAKADELIEPDLAFTLRVTAKGPNSIVAELTPAKGYYIYKEKIRFSVADASGVSIGSIKLPKGEMKNDLIFGRTEVYKKTVPVEISLSGNAKANDLTLVAGYQGCHEKLGVCYPPIEKSVNVVLR